MSPFCPQKILKPLRAQEAASSAEGVDNKGNFVQEPSTPTFTSSNKEDKEDEESATMVSSEQYLRQRTNPIRTLQFNELARPSHTRRSRITPRDFG